MKSAILDLFKPNPEFSDFPTTPTLKDAVAMYVDSIADLDDLSPNTIKHYRHDLELFVRFIHRYSSSSQVFVNFVTPRHVNAFLLDLQQRGNAASSQRRRLSALSRFFERMIEWGYFTLSPAARLKTNGVELKKPVTLTPEECIRFLTATKTTRHPVRDHTIFRLFLISACTLSELIHLRRRDVNLNRRTIRFHGRRQAPRVLRMSVTMRNALAAYLDRRDKAPAHPHAFFLNRLGNPITKGAIYHAFDIVLAAANLKKPGLSVHSLRHTSLAMLWRAGVSVHIIQRIAGHQSIATTRSYSWAGSRPSAPRPWRWIHPLEESIIKFRPLLNRFR